MLHQEDDEFVGRQLGEIDCFDTIRPPCIQFNTYAGASQRAGSMTIRMAWTMPLATPQNQHYNGYRYRRRQAITSLKLTKVGTSTGTIIPKEMPAA